MTPDDPVLVADDPVLVADDPVLVADDPPPVAADDVHERAAQRRRLASVFGDVLPGSTRDDVDDETPSERAQARSRDEEMRADVPPHHG